MARRSELIFEQILVSSFSATNVTRMCNDETSIFYEKLIRFTVEIVWIDEQMDFHSEFLEIIKIDDT